ncbi:hypothetical protein TNCV_5033521 [Trichonephila clavipes]|nr:hypothetical protein TNCV_5033521 [Trichonephila clavipes]
MVNPFGKGKDHWVPRDCDTRTHQKKVNPLRGRVLLEPPCFNSRRVECRIVLLKFPKFVEMHNGHEWVQVIRRDANTPFT